MSTYAADSTLWVVQLLPTTIYLVVTASMYIHYIVHIHNKKTEPRTEPRITPRWAGMGEGNTDAIYEDVLIRRVAMWGWEGAPHVYMRNIRT